MPSSAHVTRNVAPTQEPGDDREPVKMRATIKTPPASPRTAGQSHHHR